MSRPGPPDAGRTAGTVTALVGIIAILVFAAALPMNGAEPPKEQAMNTPHHRPALPPPDALSQLPPDGGSNYNRLVFSQSPYLLQHAANPVDWYEWGEDAFARARSEDKPIFLSIGYSTCHWCHVMERESFEDEEVAALMNESYICIKVDREERPDVDKIYMDVTQAMTGHGGWPMTVVMTPDKRPFFTGTYFPKTGRFGRPGMMDLLPQLAAAWRERRTEIEEGADQITAALRQMNTGTSGPALDESTLRTSFDQLAQRYDAARGGFGQSPKFPTPQNITFLLRYWKRTGDESALRMAESTLTAMRLAGIYDHIGFGFHRYATDRDWLLPHFEKMLYDQALIAMAYLDAYQATGKELYGETARELFAYVLRDMTSPQGGFYSAEDADSEGVEGKFYVWTTDEIRRRLNADDAALFITIYNLADAGNFTHEAEPHGGNDNIPHLSEPLAAAAKQVGTSEDALRERLNSIRRVLFDVREKRIHPFKDDKILTDWNGLMIAALARGAQVLDDPAFEEAARKAADFVLTRLRDDRGRLMKRERAGKAGLPGHLEDYSFMVWGLLNLYEATFDPRYLEEAVALNDALVQHFWDADAHGFFLTANDGEQLLVRAKEVYDGAIPSGNSVAVNNLARLARMTGNTAYEEMAHQVIMAFSGQVQQGPSAHNQLLCGLDFALGPTYEIVIADPADAPGANPMIEALRNRFLPRAVVLYRPDGPGAGRLAAIAPYTEAMSARDSASTAYVCLDFACKQPTTDTAEMIDNLGESAARK